MSTKRDWHGTALATWRDNDRVMLSLSLTGCREAGRAVRMEVPRSIIDRLVEDSELDALTIDVKHDHPTNEASLEHTLEDMLRGLPNTRYRALPDTDSTPPNHTRVRFVGPTDEIAELVQYR
jgi:hypothetical protein